MRRFLVKLEFDGRHYSGWQSQKNAPTVQAEVEKALNKLFSKEITAEGCSRTDSGVSAREYYFHFDADTKLPEDRVAFKLNRFLPKTIQALSSKEVPPSFHARSSLKTKTYAYSFYVSKHLRPLLNKDAVQIEPPFSLEKMRLEAQSLLGKHDFSSFHTVSPEGEKSPVKTITNVEIKEEGETIRLFITGDGFLYNMVRIIAGTLVEAGKGTANVEEILNSKDRSKAGKTLSSKGLILYSVQY